MSNCFANSHHSINNKYVHDYDETEIIPLGHGKWLVKNNDRHFPHNHFGQLLHDHHGDHHEHHEYDNGLHDPRCPYAHVHTHSHDHADHDHSHLDFDHDHDDMMGNEDYETDNEYVYDYENESDYPHSHPTHPNLLVIPNHYVGDGHYHPDGDNLGGGHFVNDGHNHIKLKKNTDWMSPKLLKQYNKRMKNAKVIQALTTGGLAGIGTAMGGPGGGAIGAGAGSLLGELVAPTPGETWGFARNGKKVLWSALGGALAPAILPGLAVPASIIGAGWAGYANANN